MIEWRGEVIIPIGRGHYLIESWSEDETHHAVDLEDNTCSCRGFECRGYCRHLDVIKEFLNHEANQVD